MSDIKVNITQEGKDIIVNEASIVANQLASTQSRTFGGKLWRSIVKGLLVILPFIKITKK
jgi:hypothetical protein